MSVDRVKINSPATQGQVAEVALRCSMLAGAVSRLIDYVHSTNDVVTAELDAELIEISKDLDEMFDTLTGYNKE